MAIRWHWGIGIALVYAAFAAGTTGVALFAMRQRVDLVSTDYYERSLAHDAHVAAVERARALGDGVQVRVATTDRSVDVLWHAPRDAAITGTVTLYRASDAPADRVIPIVRGADGGMRIPIADLAPGHW